MVIEQICDMAKELPASPTILPSLLELLAKEDASLNDLKAIVEKDSSLGAAVLRMANSAYYGGRGDFDELSQALLQLGFSRTHELALTVSGGRWNTVNLDGYSWEPGDFFRHNLTVAIVAKKVAEKAQPEKMEVAYAAGLIHEAGKLALAYAYPEGIEQARKRQAETGASWLDAERSVLGYSHTDISARLLKQWNFPSSLLAVASFYPYPDQADEGERRLVQIVHLAKHLAIQMGVGIGEDAFWLPLDENVLGPLSLSEQDLEELLGSSLISARKILGENMLTGRIKL